MRLLDMLDWLAGKDRTASDLEAVHRILEENVAAHQRARGQKCERRFDAVLDDIRDIIRGKANGAADH